MKANLIDTKTGFGIRPYEIGDVPEFFKAAHESIPEVHPWLPWCHPEYSIDDSKNWIEYAINAWDEREAFPFVIYALGSNKHVGGVGLNRIDKGYKRASLGYWVRTSFTRRGAASTATRLCAQFGFRQLGLLRIEIIAAVENVASQRAAEKAGATREGVLRNGIYFHGKPHDAVLFSFIPADFEPQEEPNHIPSVKSA